MIFDGTLSHQNSPRLCRRLAYGGSVYLGLFPISSPLASGVADAITAHEFLIAPRQGPGVEMRASGVREFYRATSVHFLAHRHLAFDSCVARWAGGSIWNSCAVNYGPRGGDPGTVCLPTGRGTKPADEATSEQKGRAAMPTTRPERNTFALAASSFSGRATAESPAGLLLPEFPHPGLATVRQ